MQAIPKTILISGAGRGIGRATALAFAQTGATIVITSRSESDLTSLAQEIEQCGGTAIPVVADSTNEQDVQRVVSSIQTLDILVCAAGVVYVAPFEQLSLEQWQATLDASLTATFLLCKTASPLLQTGSIIFTLASIAGKSGFPNWSAYSAAKFGLIGFSQAIREELRPRGIRVTTLIPSAVDTSLWDSIDGDWNRQNMLQPSEVASVILDVANQPPHIQMDEVGVGHVVGKL